tara:strand:- start:1020 stop:1667 length:648 start_codon:yes stop_codon:yes gene_type:complete
MSNKIISIAGISASGKTLLSKTLRDLILKKLPNSSVEIMEGDLYFKDQKDIEFYQRLKTNYDHPSAIDHGLLEEHLRLLKSGISVNVPKYDFHKHTRVDETTEIKAVELLIIPGALVLHHKKIVDYIDFSIFLDCSLDIALTRRIKRDCKERGRTAEFVEEQFQRDVIPMYHKYIKPIRNRANLVVQGEQDIICLANQIIKTLVCQQLLPQTQKQ